MSHETDAARPGDEATAAPAQPPHETDAVRFDAHEAAADKSQLATAAVDVPRLLARIAVLEREVLDLRDAIASDTSAVVTLAHACSRDLIEHAKKSGATSRCLIWRSLAATLRSNSSGSESIGSGRGAELAATTARRAPPRPGR